MRTVLRLGDLPEHGEPDSGRLPEGFLKLARFMVGLEAVNFCYAWQSEAEAREMTSFVHSGWAGCVRSHRSTSGRVLRLGRHAYAVVEGATRGIGLRSMFGDMGVTIASIGLHTDSSAAKSFASRRGTGEIRHISVKERRPDLLVQGWWGGQPSRHVDQVPGLGQAPAAEPAFRPAGRNSANCQCRGGRLVTSSPASTRRPASA